MVSGFCSAFLLYAVRQNPSMILLHDSVADAARNVIDVCDLVWIQIYTNSKRHSRRWKSANTSVHVIVPFLLEHLGVGVSASSRSSNTVTSFVS